MSKIVKLVALIVRIILGLVILSLSAYAAAYFLGEAINLLPRRRR